MSNIINLTSRLRTLSQALVMAEREEAEAFEVLEEHRLLDDEGLPIFETQYEQACTKVDEISNEIEQVENELEELSNQHDYRGEDY
jgi:hypothetical protein